MLLFVCYQETRCQCSDFIDCWGTPWKPEKKHTPIHIHAQNTDRMDILGPLTCLNTGSASNSSESYPPEMRAGRLDDDDAAAAFRLCGDAAAAAFRLCGDAAAAARARLCGLDASDEHPEWLRFKDDDAPLQLAVSDAPSTSCVVNAQASSFEAFLSTAIRTRRRFSSSSRFRCAGGRTTTSTCCMRWLSGTVRLETPRIFC